MSSESSDTNSSDSDFEIEIQSKLSSKKTPRNFSTLKKQSDDHSKSESNLKSTSDSDSSDPWSDFQELNKRKCIKTRQSSRLKKKSYSSSDEEESYSLSDPEKLLYKKPNGIRKHKTRQSYRLMGEKSKVKKSSTYGRNLRSSAVHTVTDESRSDVTENKEKKRKLGLNKDVGSSKKFKSSEVLVVEEKTTESLINKKDQLASDTKVLSESSIVQVALPGEATKSDEPVADPDQEMLTHPKETEVNEEGESSPTKSGKQRRNINKVIEEEDLAVTTRRALEDEEDRKQRIADRQKLYKKLHKTEPLKAGASPTELVLDFDHETKKIILEVHKGLVAKLKPHQIDGIKFMWDAMFETVEQSKTERGSGCILAHCMGLGKTMQVVVLAHTLLSNPQLGLKMKTILVLAPLSTIHNWCQEFTLWLADIGEEIPYFNLALAKEHERLEVLETWYTSGGVAVMGYELFRNLTTSRHLKHRQYLINPGPDMVVCDEGHLLRNSTCKLVKSILNIKTMRRLVLTGTPMQNNLMEYYCMIKFVKPHLLGTPSEFTNRFVNPIQNGQCSDSTELDVQTMKMRAHVLHKLVEGFVQRVDYSVLTPVLKTKHEYVVKVQMTDIQIQLYRYYLNQMCDRSKGSSFIVDYHNLKRVWTHPLVLLLRAEQTNKDVMIPDIESSDSDVLNSDSDETERQMEVKFSRNQIQTRAAQASSLNEKDNCSEKEWWSKFVSFDDLEIMSHSNKLVLLFSILRECQAIGDKVLVFSQSLLSLDLIETFLQKVDDATQENSSTAEFCNLCGPWVKDYDYFRIDGSTSSEDRNLFCKFFNNPSNLRARLFLISTKAGGLGINMVGANRVVLFDASWNPCDDIQAIFRVYRYGQNKTCYVYRFLSSGTMEEKVYDRQVIKLSLSGRVVDEHQVHRHFKSADLEELYNFTPHWHDKQNMMIPKDELLKQLLLEHPNCVTAYLEHDSLLENKPEEKLTEEERELAWQDFEAEQADGKRAHLPTLTAIMQQKIILKQQKAALVSNLKEDLQNKLKHGDQKCTSSSDCDSSIECLEILDDHSDLAPCAVTSTALNESYIKQQQAAWNQQTAMQVTVVDTKSENLEQRLIPRINDSLMQNDIVQVQITPLRIHKEKTLVVDLSD